jgi:putative ATP-dependent endonuclease of OLD family
MEYDLCLSNVPSTKTGLPANFLYRYLETICADELTSIKRYLDALDEQWDQAQREKVAILLWKALPDKASFAQHFALHLAEHAEDAKASFVVPPYIQSIFGHLKG